MSRPLDGMLVLDLGVFHRKTHVVGVREALVWIYRVKTFDLRDDRRVSR